MLEQSLNMPKYYLIILLNISLHVKVFGRIEDPAYQFPESRCDSGALITGLRSNPVLSIEYSSKKRDCGAIPCLFMALRA